MRVLVTEDDEILASTLAAGLRREGMAVDVALDGAGALERATGISGRPERAVRRTSQNLP